MITSPDEAHPSPDPPNQSTPTDDRATPSTCHPAPRATHPANVQDTPLASHPGLPSSLSSRLSDHLVTPAHDDDSPHLPRLLPRPSPSGSKPRRPHDRGDFVPLPSLEGPQLRLPPLQLPPPVLSHTTPLRSTASRETRETSPSEQVWRMGCCRDSLRSNPIRPRTAPGISAPSSITSGCLSSDMQPITPAPPPSGSLIHCQLTSTPPASPKPLPSILQPYAGHRHSPAPGASSAFDEPDRIWATPPEVLGQFFSSDLAFKDFRGTRLPARPEMSGRTQHTQFPLPPPLVPRPQAELPSKEAIPQDVGTTQKRRKSKGEATWKKSVCDICHIKKTKCDRAQPSCQVCLDRGYPCHYSEPGEVPTLPADVAAGKFRIPRKGMDTGLHRQGYVTIVSPSNPGETIRIQLADYYHEPTSAIRSTQQINANRSQDIAIVAPRPAGIPKFSAEAAELIRQAARTETGSAVLARVENEVIFKFWKKRDQKERAKRIRAWAEEVSGSEEELSRDREQVTLVKRRRQTGSDEGGD